MNVSAYWMGGMSLIFRKVYPLLRIGLPDALLSRAEPALGPHHGQAPKRSERSATQPLDPVGQDSDTKGNYWFEPANGSFPGDSARAVLRLSPIKFSGVWLTPSA